MQLGQSIGIRFVSDLLYLVAWAIGSIPNLLLATKQVLLSLHCTKHTTLSSIFPKWAVHVPLSSASMSFSGAPFALFRRRVPVTTYPLLPISESSSKDVKRLSMKIALPSLSNSMPRWGRNNIFVISISRNYRHSYPLASSYYSCSTLNSLSFLDEFLRFFTSSWSVHRLLSSCTTVSVWLFGSWKDASESWSSKSGSSWS